MALSMGTIAFGSVAVAAMVLFSIGHPTNQRPGQIALASPAPTASRAVPAPSIITGGTTLGSVSFDLPTSERTFPGGTAADAINDNCLACHSAGMVLNQPVLSRAVWQSEVDKMRGSYKAPVAAADVSAIVDYLAKLGDRK